MSGQPLLVVYGARTTAVSSSLLTRWSRGRSRRFADRHNHPFADDFVFHFFNSRLPDLDGDYHGFDGIAELFERLGESSENGFHQVHHSLTPCGDELLVAFVTNTLGSDGMTIDVDAVVVWRVFDGQIHEAWDIPAVNTVRPTHRQQRRA